MNVTALLDAPVRTPTPLDPSVGEEASDPAFANVMSQYHGDGNKSLAPGVQRRERGPIPHRRMRLVPTKATAAIRSVEFAQSQ